MAAVEPRLEITPSRHFTSWLAEQRVSLAFTTYQVGKLFLVGLNEDGRLALFNRTLERVMGLAAHEGSLWVATLWQLWRFENALPPGARNGAHDRWYVPQLAYTTGDIDVHDVAVDGDGNPVFVSTLFSCVARPDPRYSFVPIWKPSFVSGYAAEDRCHLNGLAMRDGRPAYATCVGMSDAKEGWRAHRAGGGLLLDIVGDAVVCAGLSMPHSPRWHRGRLWLLNAGSGELGVVDPAAGRFEPVAFCPGFLRGLTFVGDYAVVGLSKQRDNRSFSDLALDRRLAAQGVDARCALQVIDLRSGQVAHELHIEGVVTELFDVAVLPGARNPGLVGFRSAEVQRMIALPPGIV